MRRPGKKIRNMTAWILAAVLAVTMSAPAAVFAQGSVSADRTASGQEIVASDSTADGQVFMTSEADSHGQTNLADQTDITDPTDQADSHGQTNLAVQTEPSDQSNPSDQTDSTDQTDPQDQTNPTDPTDQTDPTNPTNPTDPTNPPDKTDPTEPVKPLYYNTYRVEKKKGTLYCYRFTKKGVKQAKPQKNKYFIVKFDKKSSAKARAKGKSADPTIGTAIKKVGKTGTLYYFNKSGKGKKYTGWFKQSGKKYYFKKGKRYKGTKKIKNTWYVFSKTTGKLKRTIGDDIDKKSQPYTSRTSYLIVVKLSEHKVRIYNGKQNSWNRAHTYTCTVGAPSTPTIRGTFTIGSRGRYFNTGASLRCWYWTQFCGNYLFHSVLYDRSSTPSHVVDGRLGYNLSHGCIRLALANAKWINNNIPSGTKVVIY